MSSLSINRYIQKFKNQIPYIPRTLKLIYKVSGNLMPIWVFLTIFQGFLPVIYIYFVKPLVDKLSIMVKGNFEVYEAIYSILPEIIIFTSVLLFTEILKSITKWVRGYMGELVKDNMKSLIHEKSISLDMMFFESSEYYDKLHRARIDTITKPVALLENLSFLIQNSITIFSIIGLLFVYKWWVPILLILSSLPMFFVLFVYTIKFHKWRVKTTVDERKSLYYDFVLSERETASEIRLFKLGNHFKNLFTNTRNNIRNEFVNITKKQMIAEIISVFIGLIIVGLIMLYMLIQTIQGFISFGVLTMFYIAFNQSQRTIMTLVSNATEMYKNIIFIENLFEFLDIKTIKSIVSENNIETFEINNSLKFENVSFSYPFSERKALTDFNLEIPSKKITAIVGTNGAGKSTLIKLLCRFFEPDSGNILIDNKNLNSYSQEIIHKNITVLFQDYVRFHTTAKENIAFGDIENFENEFNFVKDASEKAGANIPIEKLPKGYETVLGRWFSGAELSGGEWQRIALARAFIRNSELVILDEPTSAMDSWAETDWLKRFKELVKNKTSIIITHRFTTAMQADIIYVMDNGKVIEKGNHEELMELNGKYSKSWKSQTKQIGKVLEI